MKLLKGLLILDRSAVRSTFRQLVALSNDATSAFLVSGGSERRAPSSSFLQPLLSAGANLAVIPEKIPLTGWRRARARAGSRPNCPDSALPSLHSDKRLI